MDKVGHIYLAHKAHRSFKDRCAFFLNEILRRSSICNSVCRLRDGRCFFAPRSASFCMELNTPVLGKRTDMLGVCNNIHNIS